MTKLLGVYNKKSASTGLPTNTWYSTVRLTKTKKIYTVGTFKSEQQALDARNGYIKTMKRIGVGVE